MSYCLFFHYEPLHGYVCPMTRPDYYILKGKEVIPVDNVMDWNEWFKENNKWDEGATQSRRHVKRTTFKGINISTVFLGVSHCYEEDAAPLVFETMIFGGKHNDYQVRCSTWDEAEKQHQEAIDLVRQVS